MTELRRTNNQFVGVLRAEREFLELRSYEFVPAAISRGDCVKAFGSMFSEGPPV